MKVAILSFLAILSFVALVQGQSFYNDLMRYEAMTEGVFYNITEQLHLNNASICVNNTRNVIGHLYNYTYGSGYFLDYLINTRDLFLAIIKDIDYCPGMAPFITKIVELVTKMITDPYHFIWKFANNIAINGIDIYYHVGCTLNIIKKLDPTKSSNDAYFEAGTVLGDMIFDMFFEA